MIDRSNGTKRLALPTADEIADARAVLSNYLTPTRLVVAPFVTAESGVHTVLKLELDLPTTSFKPRGALYALTRRLRDGPVKEVVASSTGNHGAAAAYAARLLDLPATIFVPVGSNIVKRARIADLGARLIETGVDLAAAAAAAHAHADAHDAYYLDDATDPFLPAGPATIALEIFTSAPDAGTIVVPVGDSALIRGIAAVAKRQPHRVRVIGVQAERAPSYVLSWRAGAVVGTDTCDTIADGLATRTPQPANVAAIRAVVDDMVLVSETQIHEAMRLLHVDETVIAEPAGAAATAAVLAGAAGSEAQVAGRPVVALVTGGNVVRREY